jgi:hypothetical protein
MRCLLGASAAVFALSVVLARDASARHRATIAVASDAGAEECPNDDALVADIAAVTGDDRIGAVRSFADAVLVVRFSRGIDGVSARLEFRDAGARTLTDANDDCAALGKAVAVAVAVWLDEADDEEIAPAPSPPPLAPPTSPRAPRSVGVHLRLMGGGQVALGVVAPVAPSAFAAALVELGPLGVGGGVRWLPARQLPVAAGTVDVGLAGGWVDGCVAIVGDAGLLVRSLAFRLHPCATMAAAALHATAKGFASSSSALRPWFALGGAVIASVRLLGPLAAFGRAEALIPSREAFEVTGAGIAYEPTAVAALLGGGLELRAF